MTAPRNRATVLVVDDERGPRESLRIILKPAYHVLAASSGTEALEILRTIPVDLVTLDLNMPGIKGEDLLATIRRQFPEVEIIVITGWGTVESASEAVRFGIADYLQKPFDVVQVMASVTRAVARQRGRRELIGFLEGIGNALGREREVGAIIAELDANRSLRDQLRLAIDRASAASGQGREPLRTLAMLEMLAETIEAKDLHMAGHARRTAYYASLLADRLCLSVEQREHIRIASFLHDIGKVGVPEELLSKPGPLDAEERDVLEAHPEVGARIVEPMGIASEIVEAIRHHHERWDGGGYPSGLTADEIPLAARIVQLADVYDALVSERPHRRARSRHAACAEIARCAGTQFDPDLAKEFVSVLETQSSELEPEVLAEVVSTSARESAAPSMQTGGVRS
jgi:putative nucleotidyltransferase with HDIG domain